MKKKETFISLRNIRLYAYHGVLPQETLVGNNFIINLKIKADLSKAMETDNIEDTLNYGEIYNIVKDEMAIPSALLEHICNRIVKKLIANFSAIESIYIELAKQNPPLGGEIESAVISMYTER